MLRTVRSLVVAPSEAAAWEAAERHPVLGRPALVLFALGVATLVAAFAPVLFIGPGRLPDDGLITYALGDQVVTFPRQLVEVVVLLLAVPFVFCLYVTVLTYVPTAVLAALAAVRRGEASVPGRLASDPVGVARRRGQAFARTYGLVAVGFGPQFAATLFTGGALVAALAGGADASEGLIRVTPAGHLVSVVDDAPALTAATRVVGAAATLVSGLLWTGAVGRGAGVSHRPAVAVVVPVTLLLVYVSDLAGHFGL
ncbi:hypothetical protein HZS55_02270 [Halosimplex rubrum]|uniref:Yip1 domain-containing protein n=1 Tax=Halosimplex rubrum TaxID=869889 RepID=A0A7D5P2Y3_9EURY|nr:hypothetical protein [Halosimplex rubrum]QLH76202.1 hypothetical protein HZS55_02270 [Halosimplex rubrum]